MTRDDKASFRDLDINEPLVYEEGGRSYFSSINERMKIKDLDVNDRPMEKLKFKGSKSLSDVELLAILIGSGTSQSSSLDLAYKLLSLAGNYEILMEMTVEELTQIKGIGLAKASRIIAGLELGRRIKARDSIRKYKISRPEDVYDLYKERFKYENVEHLFVILLDSKNQIIGEALASKGDLNRTIVNPREVYRIAIKRSCNSIMLVHNHPSGDPKPSRADIGVTKRLLRAGEILGIEILDHIIIGYNEFSSLKRQGLIEEF